jgi:hypothetical protein
MNFATFETAARAVTGASLLIGMLALLWPTSLPKDVRAPTERAGQLVASAPQHDQRDNTLIAQVNIFSASRAAPNARYRPYGYEQAAEQTPARAPAASTRPAPLLFGTVMGDRPGALLSLDPNVPGAQMYHEGDRAGGYRVVKIGERSVTLTGPAGQIVLQLNRAEGQTP